MVIVEHTPSPWLLPQPGALHQSKAFFCFIIWEHVLILYHIAWSVMSIVTGIYIKLYLFTMFIQIIEQMSKSRWFCYILAPLLTYIWLSSYRCWRFSKMVLSSRTLKYATNNYNKAADVLYKNSLSTIMHSSTFATFCNYMQKSRITWTFKFAPMSFCNLTVNRKTL